MNLYKTTIKPESNFGTTLKGDTIFGQLCWAIRYAFGNDRLEELLKRYEEKPFVVVSDAFAKGYLPKPTIPTMLLGENSEDKKINRKKIWLNFEELQSGKYSKAETSKEINFSYKEESIIKNAINYKSFTTGDGFDPYSENESIFSDVDVYILLDEDVFSLQELEKSFELLSQWGYGKNTTIGKGRFSFAAFEKVDLKKSFSNSFMGLSPASIEGIDCKDIYYNSFVRFGKHGGDLATKSPFKKPLLLADSGFVVVFDDTKELQYIGKGIKGHSKHKDTVHQGYSIVVPIKELGFE